MFDFLLIYLHIFDKLYSWGVTEHGKRFAFRQSEYILRTSSIFGGVQMENKVKGITYDVRNDSQYCWYCSDGYQYYCHDDQYHTECKET